jgi:type II secretory pathway component GspD/PulD (secretin)
MNITVKHYDRQEKTMMFEKTVGQEARSARQTFGVLLVTGALCCLACVQSVAAPAVLPVSAVKMATHTRIYPHRSVWAIKWAAAHPALEAAYLARIQYAHHAHYQLKAVPAKLKIVAEAAAPVTLKPIVSVVPTEPFSSQVAQPLPETIASTQPAKFEVAAVSTAPVPAPRIPAPPAPAATETAMAAPVASSGFEKLSRSAQSDERTLGDVTLDFVAADINDVIKALAVQTGANIVSSTDVKGTITISLSQVTLDQALDMITRLSGFQYAKVGNTYVIGTASGISALTNNGSGPTTVTAVVTFNYASVADLESALTSRFPDLKVCDGSSISGADAGAQYKALVLSGDPAYVSQAKDLVTQIDASLGANVTQQTTVVYQVQSASVADLISIVGSLVPTVIVTPGPRQGFTAKAPTASASAGSSGASAEGTSGSGGSASGATGASQSNSTGPNLLLLTGTPTDVAKAQTILAEVDVEPAQIEFDTKVTEIDVNKVNNLGINWNFTGSTTRIGEEPDNIASGTPTLGENGQSNLLGFGAIGRTAISDIATLTMDALLQNGDAKLLADPNISAINGQPAEVFIGNTVNYVESITQSTTGENVTTASVQVGVILRVTGRVGSDGYITLNIHPEVSEITGELSVPGGGQLPEVSSRYADTTVRVKNGETIAIGGLIQENDNKNVNSVPGLGNLPIIGKLFQDSQDTKTRTEVVFLLTTKVVQ